MKKIRAIIEKTRRSGNIEGRCDLFYVAKHLCKKLLGREGVPVKPEIALSATLTRIEKKLDILLKHAGIHEIVTCRNCGEIFQQFHTWEGVYIDKKDEGFCHGCYNAMKTLGQVMTDEEE